MSVCSVLHEVNPSLPSPTKDATLRPPSYHGLHPLPDWPADAWCARFPSANPPESPFAFATNTVQFACAETKYKRDRSTKRVKLDRR
ncbi:hypothetical protein B0H19DRAFT_326431 [Mycena capillaripes]|nr:hypothetical protein B0H19DRAFT_326431 [Mycena capillaripes]